MENTISVLAIGRSTYEEGLDLCLTSRALGASEITFIGKPNSRLIRYINNLNTNWGGKFKVSYAKSYQQVIKASVKYKTIYLTKYGDPLQSHMYALKTYKNIVLVVSLKENLQAVHKIVDFNLSVSSQQHCAVAAIAIFLHEFYNGRELAMHFENAKYKMVPTDGGIYKEEVRE